MPVIKKEGSAFDVAIAVGILVANENIPKESVENKVFCGELSLDGKLRAISGILPRAALLHSLADRPDFFVPADNAKEATCVEGLRVFAIRCLADLIRYLKGEITLEPQKGKPFMQRQRSRAKAAPFDFSDIRGQMHAKRGLEIAAAGGHNVLST